MAKQPQTAARGSRSADQLLIRLPGNMRKHLAQVAERHGRSMNAEVVTALSIYFAELTVGEPRGQFTEQLADMRAAIDALTKEVAELRKVRREK